MGNGDQPSRDRYASGDGYGFRAEIEMPQVVSSLTGMPSPCIKRSLGRPPVLSPNRPTISQTLFVRLA